MNIVELWNSRHASGLIRFDPDTAIIVAPAGNNWGSVYYSPIRERYKTEVKHQPSASFDLELMERMNLFDADGLRIAANPNSLFPGHLVIYPGAKSDRLSKRDLTAISQLAIDHPEFTFIHNAERSAASILDWAHFQAYAMQFPLADMPVDLMMESERLVVSTVAETYPAYALVFESSNVAIHGEFLSGVADLLASSENPHAQPIPMNLIWGKQRVWIVPRAKAQSDRAARYFGGLELGGIFCLPARSEAEFYTHERLSQEVKTATFRTPNEKDARDWFEKKILELAATL